MIKAATVVMVAIWTSSKPQSHFSAADNTASIITSNASTNCTAKRINKQINCDWACENRAYLHKMHMFRK